MQSRALADAAADGDVATVRSLLQAGKDPNSRAADQTPTLVGAVQSGSLELTQVLLQADADVTAHDAQLNTASDWLAHAGLAVTGERKLIDHHLRERGAREPLAIVTRDELEAFFQAFLVATKTWEDLTTTDYHHASRVLSAHRDRPSRDTWRRATGEIGHHIEAAAHASAIGFHRP